MEAGRFRERVTFEAPSGATDALGGTVDQFEAQFTCWAHFARPRSSERVQGDREASRDTIIVLVRRSPETLSIQSQWQMRDTRNAEAVFAIHAIDKRRQDGLVSVTVETSTQ